VSTLLSSAGAFAQGNIGVIDLEGVLIASNYSRQQYQSLQADTQYKKLLGDIKVLKGELQALQKKGETNALTWSEDQKKNHIQKGQVKLEQYKRLGAQEAQMRNGLASSIEKKLGPSIEKIVNSVIEEKKIGLLLKSQAVFYRTAEFDITEEVVKRLNDSQ
jgi:Skp family chaperone for outer membrane proteins